MNEVVCGNGLPGMCTLSSQSSRWCLAMIYFLPRMRTVWGTPQWGSMGWTLERITNGWNEGVLMMQFVDDGWMRLFQKMVCLLQGQGFGGGPLIWGLRELDCLTKGACGTIGPEWLSPYCFPEKPGLDFNETSMAFNAYETVCYVGLNKIDEWPDLASGSPVGSCLSGGTRG